MRECGMLLPVSSLPSRYGIGAFSGEAYDFIDTLQRAGQKYWQILPLGPTGYGDSRRAGTLSKIQRKFSCDFNYPERRERPSF